MVHLNNKYKWLQCDGCDRNHNNRCTVCTSSSPQSLSPLLSLNNHHCCCRRRHRSHPCCSLTISNGEEIFIKRITSVNNRFILLILPIKCTTFLSFDSTLEEFFFRTAKTRSALKVPHNSSGTNRSVVHSRVSSILPQPDLIVSRH